MTHREARRKLGSRTSRRAGSKTQCIPGRANSHSGTKAGPTECWRIPRMHPKHPTPAARVWALVKAGERL